MNGGPITRVVTHGTFELDGGSWEVDNNIWIVGDDSEVIVFDAAHEAAPILAAVGGRNVVAVVCTHGHNDHVTVAPELGEALDDPEHECLAVGERGRVVPQSEHGQDDREPERHARDAEDDGAAHGRILRVPIS